MGTSISRSRRFAAALIIASVLTGCEAFVIGAPPPPMLDIATMYPSNGSTYNASLGAIYTAEAKATVAYRSAEGGVRDPDGFNAGLGSVHAMNTGELYMPSRPLQVEFQTYRSGLHTFDATFYGEYGATASGTSSFTVNLAGAPRVEPEPSRDGASVQAKTVYCPPEDPAGCGGGGGGGGGTPWLQRRGLPDRSQEPFFLVTNEPDGDLSESDVEARANAWSPQARAQMTEFFDVVYDAQLDRLAQFAPGYTETGHRIDRLRAVADALDREAPRIDGLRWQDAMADVLDVVEAENIEAEVVQPEAADGSRALTTGPEYEPGIRIYPNPTSASVTVRAPAGTSTIAVYNVLDRRVATLHATAGVAVWNVRDVSGRRVPSGVYTIVIEGQNGRRVQRVTVL